MRMTSVPNVTRARSGRGSRQFAEAVAEYAERKAEFDGLTRVTSVSAPHRARAQIRPRTSAAAVRSQHPDRVRATQRVARVSARGQTISDAPGGNEPAAASLVANVRDEAGATSPNRASARSGSGADAQDQHLQPPNYPIGHNVDLASVRVRSLTRSAKGPSNSAGYLNRRRSTRRAGSLNPAPRNRG